MRNLVLIGMMGCGKSTVGALLSRRLKRPLVDTDALIERQTGQTIPELFETQGESGFRALEVGVAQALSLRGGLVIACGGGLPLREAAMGPLKESGVVFWLDRDAGDIYDHEDMTDRPLAQAGREAFLRRAAEREDAYRRWADFVVTDFTSPVATAARVLERWEGKL